MIKKAAIPFFYLGIFLFAAVGMRDDGGVLVPLRLINGASKIVHYYVPQRLALTSTPRETKLRLPAFHGTARFATLAAGTGADSLITIALDESADGWRRIYVDRNNNGDLTDDGPDDWDEIWETYVATSALIDVDYAPERRCQLSFRFYRFTTRLPDLMLYYRDYFATGTLALAGGRYQVALVDDNADGRFDDLQNTALVVDTNEDGILQANPAGAEMFGGREAFYLPVGSYVLRQVAADGQWARFGISPRPAAPRARIAIDQPAPQFSMPDIDGAALRLDDFRGRVVLLHFWTTWCKPCLSELPPIIAAYHRFHGHAGGGFDIISVSLDEDPQALRRFLATHDMPWRHLCDGRGWQTQVVQQYRLTALPYTMLVDGNGIIRRINPRGAELTSAIEKLLNERSGRLKGENPEARSQKPE